MNKIVLLPFLLLLQIALGAERKWNFGTHVATTENGTLKSVECFHPYRNDKQLKLVNLGLKSLDINAFANGSCSQIRKLNLRNNWLSTIPAFVFKDFHFLTSLSIANNEIANFAEFAFAKLDKLVSLNISNNRLTQLRKHQFFGLAPQNIHIYAQGNNITNISSFLFMEPAKVQREDHNETNTLPTDNSNSTVVEVCLTSSRIVKRVDLAPKTPYTNYFEYCLLLKVNHADGALNLSMFNIKGFENDWFRINNSLIKSIIVNLKPPTSGDPVEIADLLNDLPANFEEAVVFNDSYVPNGFNWYQELDKISNEHLHTLTFKRMALAINWRKDLFEYMKNLSVLNIHQAKIYGLYEVNLPASLTELNLSQVKLDENLSERVFSKLNRLIKLRLNGVEGIRPGNRWFRDLSSLQILDLSDNKLTTLEPGVFQNLASLKDLNLRGNRIHIYKGIFTGLENIEVLNIADNALREITDDTLYGMPDTLKTVILDENEIETLNEDSFLRVPKDSLSLAGNKIANINNGSINLPTLKRLSLARNKLVDFDVENLQNLEFLDVSENLIKRLDIDALSRRPMDKECIFKVSKTLMEFYPGL